MRALAAAVLVLAMTACAPAEEPDPPVLGEARSVAAAPRELAQAKEDAGIEPCPATNVDTEVVPGGLPDIVLQCLGGGRAVRLASVAVKPTVINLWASWCEPCRKELPLFEQLHDEAGDEVQVLGIDYADDSPASALALAASTGVTFPLLADPDQTIRESLQVVALPHTVFITEEGVVVAMDRKEFRSYNELSAAVLKHLGVVA